MAVKSSDPIDILLEMGIDLDNLSEEEDYLSALKEAIATIQFQTKGGGDERSAILSQEVIKVRKSRKAADPTFKAKKTTIKPDAFFDRKKPDEPVPGQKALPGSAVIKGGAIVNPSDIKPPEKEEEKDTKLLPGGDILKDILRGVNSILGTLQNQNKFKKKQSEKDRKSTEKKKRGAQEDKLEKGALKKFAGGAKKLLKPVTNFFADILKFIGTVLIGRLLVKIIDWMSDKDNQEKLTAIGDFFKNTWPVLLAAYLLFGNSFGRFAVKLIKVVGGFVFKLASKIIPALFGAARKFGFGKSAALVGTAVGGVMLAGRMMDGGKDDVDMTKSGDETKPADGKDKSEPPSVSSRFDMEAGQGYINDRPVSLEEYQSYTNMSADEKAQKYGTSMKGGGSIVNDGDSVVNSYSGGGSVFNNNSNTSNNNSNNSNNSNTSNTSFSISSFSNGGKVPGSGPNKDSVPAMLAPGEFVMSRGAVSKYGADTLASMNAAGGGTNLPKRMNGVTYAVGGGLMGGMSDYGYGDDKKEKPSSQVQSEMKEREKTKGDNGSGFLSGITGGVKSLFGGGGDDKEKGREGESEEKSSGSTLSKTQQEALQVLAKYESGAAGYDAVNQIGTKGGRGVEGFSGDIKKMPQHKGRSLTDFTVGEIKALQHDDKTMSNEEWKSAGKLHAVGAYQFIGNTLPGVAARAGIPDTAKFSPAVQDLMALQLIKERGISPWVGPSDKATAAERAIVEKARSEPIAYDKTSGGGAITAFGGGGGGSYTPPGQSGGSGGGKSSGDSKGVMSAEEMSDLFSGYKTIGKVNAGPSLLDLYNEQERSAGRPEGFKPGGLKFKKPPSSTSSTSGLEINSRSTINMQQKGAEGAGSMGNQSNASPNPAATNVAPSNDLPEINANAMISQEKIKVLGITVV